MQLPPRTTDTNLISKHTIINHVHSSKIQGHIPSRHTVSLLPLHPNIKQQLPCPVIHLCTTPIPTTHNELLLLCLSVWFRVENRKLKEGGKVKKCYDDVKGNDMSTYHRLIRFYVMQSLVHLRSERRYHGDHTSGSIEDATQLVPTSSRFELGSGWIGRKERTYGGVFTIAPTKPSAHHIHINICHVLVTTLTMYLQSL